MQIVHVDTWGISHVSNILAPRKRVTKRTYPRLSGLSNLTCMPYRIWERFKGDEDWKDTGFGTVGYDQARWLMTMMTVQNPEWEYMVGK